MVTHIIRRRYVPAGPDAIETVLFEHAANVDVACYDRSIAVAFWSSCAGDCKRTRQRPKDQKKKLKYVRKAKPVRINSVRLVGRPFSTNETIMIRVITTFRDLSLCGEYARHPARHRGGVGVFSSSTVRRGLETFAPTTTTMPSRPPQSVRRRVVSRELDAVADVHRTTIEDSPTSHVFDRCTVGTDTAESPTIVIDHGNHRHGRLRTTLSLVKTTDIVTPPCRPWQRAKQVRSEQRHFTPTNDVVAASTATGLARPIWSVQLHRNPAKNISVEKNGELPRKRVSHLIRDCCNYYYISYTLLLVKWCTRICTSM